MSQKTYTEKLLHFVK